MNIGQKVEFDCLLKIIMKKTIQRGYSEDIEIMTYFLTEKKNITWKIVEFIKPI